MKKLFHWLLLLVMLSSLRTTVQAQTGPPNITAAEYFFDTDPGVGNGTSITISTPGQLVNFPASMPVSGLVAGYHTLYVRVKDADGVWSMHQSFPFRIYRQVKKAEYFIDTDPGVGMGVAISMAQTDTLLQNFSVPLAGVLPGKHTLYVRTADVNGVWSLQQAQTFDIRSQLLSGEYFIDTDPGEGAATAFATTTADTISQNLSISLTGVPSGEHWLYTRTKNAEGKWSLPERRRFWIQPQVVAGEYFLNADPGIGKGFSININAADTANYSSGLVIPVCTPAGTHQLYIRTKDDRQKWSLYEGQEITVPANLNPGVVTATIISDTTKCDDGTRMRFYNPANGKILTSIQYNTQTLAGAKISTYVRANPYSAAGLRFMSRSYVVRTTAQPTGPVRLRLYFTQAEFDAYKAGDNTVNTISDLTVLEYQGPTEDDIYNPADAINLRRFNPVATGTEYGANYVEIETAGFSEFYILGQAIILPVQLLAFDAKAINSYNQLRWQTTREQNSQYFEVERSDDGLNFYSIGRIAAAGNTVAIWEYTFDDRKPFGSMVYYRLAMYDKDGKTTRSRQIALQQSSGKDALVLLPNPVTTQAYIKLPASWQGAVQWKIVNATGATITQGKTTAQNGAVLSLLVQALATGNYSVEVQYGTTRQLLKMIKQ